MATILKYKEREALKALAARGSDDEVRRVLAELLTSTPLRWLAGLAPSLPIRAARNALVFLALWYRYRERGGRDSMQAYLQRWVHEIEREGRIPSPDGKNALAAFVAPPASPSGRYSY